MTELGSSASMIGSDSIHGEKSANVIFDNPAGLNNINGISAGSFYTELMDGEIQFRNLSLGINTHVGSFAIGVMESAVSDIPQTAFKTMNTFKWVHLDIKTNWPNWGMPFN